MFRTILVALALTLTACFYQPMYLEREGHSVQQDLNEVELGHLPNREGQILRNYLIDGMYQSGYPSHALYTLNISITETKAGLGVKSDGVITRYRVLYVAVIELRNKETGEVALKTSTQAASSYNAGKEQFGILAAYENAKERALKELSIQIIDRLSVYLKNAS